MTDLLDLSIIIPVTERHDEITELYRAYKQGVAACGKRYEFVFVLDGDYPQVFQSLRDLIKQGEGIKIVKLAKAFGEATALNIGFEKSTGAVIMTLPAYEQIKSSEICRLVGGLADHDMVVTRRWPRIDSWLNRLQSSVFNSMLRLITDLPFHDLGCGVRVFKRQVAKEVHLYGDQHRFFPLLAYRLGFKVLELEAPQSEKDAFRRIYSPGIYIRRMLDLLTVFFLIKFTKKPLRFFGLLGSGVFSIGAVVTLWLVIERMFYAVPLADRPALVLASLMIVLGIQIFAIGLIGELIIFTHAKSMKEYAIAEVIN